MPHTPEIIRLIEQGQKREEEARKDRVSKIAAKFSYWEACTRIDDLQQALVEAREELLQAINVLDNGEKPSSTEMADAIDNINKTLNKKGT